MPARSHAAGGLPAFPGVMMPPRKSLHPDDIVTPGQAARLLRIPGGTVRSLIHRNGIEPLGRIGRWHVYDFNELAAAAQPAREHPRRRAA